MARYRPATTVHRHQHCAHHALSGCDGRIERPPRPAPRPPPLSPSSFRPPLSLWPLAPLPVYKPASTHFSDAGHPRPGRSRTVTLAHPPCRPHRRPPGQQAPPGPGPWLGAGRGRGNGPMPNRSDDPDAGPGHPGVGQPDGPAGLRAELARRAPGALGPGWDVDRWWCGPCGRRWPVTARLPSALLTGASPPSCDELAGRFIYRGGMTWSTGSISGCRRLPVPRCSPSTTWCPGVSPTRASPARRRRQRPAGRGGHLPVPVLGRRGRLPAGGGRAGGHPQRCRPGRSSDRHSGHRRQSSWLWESGCRSSSTPGAAPFARTWPAWPTPGPGSAEPVPTPPGADGAARRPTLGAVRPSGRHRPDRSGGRPRPSDG